MKKYYTKIIKSVLISGLVFQALWGVTPQVVVQKVNEDNKFSLQMRLDKKSVMVGEPVLVTVYFSLENGVRLSENPQYNAPTFKGFFVKELKEEKSYREGNRQVTELRYLLTPQKEGNFSIEPATAKIGVADTSRRDMFGRFFGTVWIPISSNSINIEIYSSKGRIGFKGLYLQMPIEIACSNLAEKLKDERFNKVKNGCYIGNGYFNSAEILSEHGKVTYIGILNEVTNSTNELFKIDNMDFKQFARKFVKHYDWINNLEYELVRKETFKGNKIFPSYCNTDYGKKYKFCIDEHKNIELKYLGEEPSFD